MQDLLEANDPDWQAFSEKDPSYFLRVAGEAIRDYCGWHIYPSLTVTEPALPIGSRGIIMLPSRYVTDVSVVAVQPNPQSDATVLAADSYLWNQGGWIEPINTAWSPGYSSGYYYGPDTPFYNPVTQPGYASVTFTHGYDAVPETIKQLAYELATTTMILPAGGNVKEIDSPGFKLVTGGGAAFGCTLTTDQKTRLANYRIGAVK